MKKFMFIVLGLMIISVSLIAQDSETPVPKDWSWIWQAVTGVLVLIGGFFKVTSDKFKGKMKQLAVFGSEAVDVLGAGTHLANVTIDAAADNVFTAEEKSAMKAAAEDWKDQKVQAVAAWKLLISKENIPS